MLCILSKQILLELVDAVEVAFAIEIGSDFHCSKRGPALRIYNVSILECFLHIIGYCELSA